MEVSMRILTDTACKEKYGKMVNTDQVICAGVNTGACHVNPNYKRLRFKRICLLTIDLFADSGRFRRSIRDQRLGQ